MKKSRLGKNVGMDLFSPNKVGGYIETQLLFLDPPSIPAEDDERIAMPCEEDVGIRDVKQNLQLSTDAKYMWSYLILSYAFMQYIYIYVYTYV